MDQDYANTFIYHVQKFKLPLILLAVALTLLGVAGTLASGDASVFIVFGIPGVLLYLLVHLTKPKDSNRQSSNFKDKIAELGRSTTKKASTEVKAETSIADELLKWHELKNKNIISEDEFQKKRDELLKSER